MQRLRTTRSSSKLSSSSLFHSRAIWLEFCVFKVWQREAQNGRQACELIQLLACCMHACSEVMHTSGVVCLAFSRLRQAQPVFCTRPCMSGSHRPPGMYFTWRCNLVQYTDAVAPENTNTAPPPDSTSSTSVLYLRRAITLLTLNRVSVMRSV